MPHPPRLMVSGNYEGGLTPAACPLGGAFALYGVYHLQTCVVLIWLNYSINNLLRVTYSSTMVVVWKEAGQYYLPV